jgi:hypothetical protein
LNPWIECVCVTGLAFAGLLAGAGISHLGRKTSLAACLASVVCVFVLAGLCRTPGYVESPILFAFVAGRAKLVLLSFIVPFGLASAMPYLVFRWEQWMVIGLCGVAIYVFGVFPFLGSAMAAGGFEGTPSYFDSNGVCRQSTSFTCGPAAGATALRRLGVAASESQLAILGRSCPLIGTTDFDLLRSVETVGAGRVRCRYYPSHAALKLDENQVLLAILSQSYFVNHCVAIIGVTEDAVVFADPADGVITLPRSYFESIWSGKGILVSR